MATFAYTARDKSGIIRKGSLFAVDRTAAAANLIDRGLVPILVKVTDETKKSGFSIRKLLPGSKVKMTEKVVFSRQFATMINAGVPITQSLTILRQQTSNPHFKAALTDAAKKVEGGATLSSALAD